MIVGLWRSVLPSVLSLILDVVGDQGRDKGCWIRAKAADVSLFLPFQASSALLWQLWSFARLPRPPPGPP